MNTDQPQFNRGDHVTWNDPDGGLCSRSGKITRLRVLHHPVRKDSVIFLTLDNVWTVEALPDEITPFHPCPSVFIRG